MKKQILEINAKIIGSASVVGHKEKEGPLGAYFDLYDKTDKFNQKTWEKAEIEMQKTALSATLAKMNLSVNDIDAMFAGDLLNQCIGSSYGLLDFDIPFFGIYGACSTAVEGLMLASLIISGGHFKRCATISSSHFCSAEQQYRTPIEYGGQRSPTAQWTVTGSAAFIVADKSAHGVKITRAMPGIVIDQGINDAANMGAAMAPATIDTLSRFFKESNTTPFDYDAIYTGDLGLEGSKILRELLYLEGFDLRDNYYDCGNLIFDPSYQDVHSGGSGCGCSAVVLSSYILPKLKSGELKKVLMIGTGAMMSPSSLKQGLSIPAIAHLIQLESEAE
jgi:stage V sporulation protein AD